MSLHRGSLQHHSPSEQLGSSPAKCCTGCGRLYLSGDGCGELSLRCYIRSLCWSHPQASSNPSSSVLPPAEATLLPIHRGGTERLHRVAWGFRTVVALLRQFLPLKIPSLYLTFPCICPWKPGPHATFSRVFVDPLS